MVKAIPTCNKMLVTDFKYSLKMHCIPLVYLLLYLKLGPLVPCVLGIDCCCAQLFQFKSQCCIYMAASTKTCCQGEPWRRGGKGQKRSHSAKDSQEERAHCPADISSLSSILLSLILLLVCPDSKKDVSLLTGCFKAFF